MVQIPHRKLKFEYLSERQGFICPISKDKWSKGKGPLRQIHNILHHYRIHDTKSNRIKYPHIVHSLLNLVAVSIEGHQENPFWGRVSKYQVDFIETFLARHPKISRWANNPDHILFSDEGLRSSFVVPVLNIDKSKLSFVLFHFFKEIIYGARSERQFGSKSNENYGLGERSGLGKVCAPSR